jgi:hypothetical protein
MQDLFNHLSPEELVEHMRKATDDSDAQFGVSIMIEADEGTTISGDEIADLMEERERTGVSMAKLAQKLKNVKIQTVITPGPGVPEIAARKKHKR